MTSLTVAAVQFATGGDVDENLATCCRMIDAAAQQGAELVVLPEFANHRSVYADAEHCRAVAVDVDGPFVAAVADRARAHRIHVVLTATVRRPDRVTVTNLMIDPNGRVIGESDKQTLMGNERAHLDAGPSVAPVIDTTLGPIGMYSCMDGVTCEVPRALAVRGARLLTNSLNSFARDEASLHIPVRAHENQVFVVAANKVGPLLPPDQVESFSEALGVPADALHGAGESQVVAPDGTVLARGPLTGEAVVTATVDLDDVDRVRAADPRPARRPHLYAALAAPATAEPSPATASSLAVAAVAVPGALEEALGSGAPLVVAPELTAVPGTIPTGVVLVTSRRDGHRHVGVVVGADGVVLEQPQLHATPRLDWATGLGDRLRTVDLPWGRLAVLVGDDSRQPETARLAALAGVSVIAVVHAPPTEAAVELALLERAAENRCCLVAAAPDSPAGGTLAASPPADSLWSPERSAPYDGTINTPAVTRLDRSDTWMRATVYPARARQREVSRDTDVVGGRSLAAAALLVG